MTRPAEAVPIATACVGGILVVSESAPDAVLIKSLLKESIEQVAVRICPDASMPAAEFLELRPKVLLLAFREIDKAEQCYLGLYRSHSAGALQPHRTILLCTTESVKQAFELCRRGLFDDYVLFWPMTYDAPRLRMTIHRAFAELAAFPENAPSARTIAVQAQRILQLEALLSHQLTRGQDHIQAAGHAVARAERGVGTALDGLSSSILDAVDAGQMADIQGAVAAAIMRCNENVVTPQFQSVSESLLPLTEWARELRHTVSVHRNSGRALGEMSGRVRAVVLIVDADELEQRLLSVVLEPEGYQVKCASSSTEALRQLSRAPVDIILMGFKLPELNGIEVMKRIKDEPRFAAIPVIMITANSDRDVVVGSRRLGAADFIVKPVDRNVILDKLRRLCAAAESTMGAT